MKFHPLSNFAYGFGLGTIACFTVRYPAAIYQLYTGVFPPAAFYVLGMTGMALLMQIYPGRPRMAEELYSANNRLGMPIGLSACLSRQAGILVATIAMILLHISLSVAAEIAIALGVALLYFLSYLACDLKIFSKKLQK